MHSQRISICVSRHDLQTLVDFEFEDNYDRSAGDTDSNPQRDPQFHRRRALKALTSVSSTIWRYRFRATYDVAAGNHPPMFTDLPVVKSKNAKSFRLFFEVDLQREPRSNRPPNKGRRRHPSYDAL